MKCRIMLARFPGESSEHPDSSQWMTETLVKCGAKQIIKKGAGYTHFRCDHERISDVIYWYHSNTPITMVRNLCLKQAKAMGCDYVLMIDNDMCPDEPNPGSKPFWETAFDWIWGRPPCMIAAPYVGKLPVNNVFIFRWSDHNNKDDMFKVEQYGRFEAAERTGIEQVAALPTGLLLFDMRMLERMPEPWFYYEWNGASVCEKCHGQHGPLDKKASTEDVTFTRDASLAWHDVPGAGCFVAWDCWAEHIKKCHLGKPRRITSDQVGYHYREALKSIPSDEGVIEIPYENEFAAADAAAGRAIIDVYEE